MGIFPNHRKKSCFRVFDARFRHFPCSFFFEKILVSSTKINLIQRVLNKTSQAVFNVTSTDPVQAAGSSTPIFIAVSLLSAAWHVFELVKVHRLKRSVSSLRTFSRCQSCLKNLFQDNVSSAKPVPVHSTKSDSIRNMSTPVVEQDTGIFSQVNEVLTGAFRSAAY